MLTAILVINVGSSSIKFALYQDNTATELLLRGNLTAVENNIHCHLSFPKEEKTFLNSRYNIDNAIGEICHLITHYYPDCEVIAIGHRIVHGGTKYHNSVVINNTIAHELSKLNPLAPQHQPYNLMGVKQCQQRFIDIPQVACFDTTFHHTQANVNQAYALPQDLTNNGIKRYGFHGLSYQYICDTLPKLIGDKAYGNIIIAHLGHGASLCACRQLKSVYTTMGFSALAGLPMGTRCGDLDPGVLLYLIDQCGYTSDQISDLLYNQSGLLGLSGISDDCSELLSSHHPRAKFAINYFCEQVNLQLGQCYAALGGCDSVIFTAGIGQHAAPIREIICKRAHWLNITLDSVANKQHQPVISTQDSTVNAFVMATNEEYIIAKNVKLLLD